MKCSLWFIYTGARHWGAVARALFAAAGVEGGQIHHTAKTKFRPRPLRLLSLAWPNTGARLVLRVYELTVPWWTAT